MEAAFGGRHQVVGDDSTPGRGMEVVVDVTGEGFWIAKTSAKRRERRESGDYPALKHARAHACMQARIRSSLSARSVPAGGSCRRRRRALEAATALSQTPSPTPNTQHLTPIRPRSNPTGLWSGLSAPTVGFGRVRYGSCIRYGRSGHRPPGGRRARWKRWNTASCGGLRAGLLN